MVGRPQYLDIPIPTPNGAAPPPSAIVEEFVGEVLNGKYTPTSTPVATAEQAPVQTADRVHTAPPSVNPPPRRAAIPPFKMMDESGPNTQLLAAIDKVYRVAAAQIAFHEKEAKKLRDALIPFASFQAPAEGAPTAPTAEAYIQSLLEAAGQLERPQ